MAIVLKSQSSSTSDAIVVPAGTYRATLTKVTAFSNAYGERIGFEFTLHGEGVEGQKVMRSTNTALSPKSKLAEVLRGLMGRELTEAESLGINAEDLVGTVCMVYVSTGKSRNGATYSNVEGIFPAQPKAA